MEKPKVIENGKLQYSEVQVVKGVTAEMVSYFREHYNSHKDTESYRMWHPDHIECKVLKQGGPGNEGRVTLCKERVGKYMVIFKTRAVRPPGGGPPTIVANHRSSFLSFPLYTVRTQMTQEVTAEGYITRATMTIGSDIPVWGYFWNFITRKFIFTEKLHAAHDKHASEEFENMGKLINNFWAERSAKS